MFDFLKKPFAPERAFSKKEKDTDEVIQCAIKTPQFQGSQDNFWMKKQTGSFNYQTMVFTPDNNPENDKGEVGKHRVQFHSMGDFKKARIK